MALLPMPLNDLEGHFAVWNLSNSHTSCNIARIYKHSASRGPSAIAELLVLHRYNSRYMCANDANYSVIKHCLRLKCALNTSHDKVLFIQLNPRREHIKLLDRILNQVHHRGLNDIWMNRWHTVLGKCLFVNGRPSNMSSEKRRLIDFFIRCQRLCDRHLILYTLHIDLIHI